MTLETFNLPIGNSAGTLQLGRENHNGIVCYTLILDCDFAREGSVLPISKEAFEALYDFRERKSYTHTYQDSSETLQSVCSEFTWDEWVSQRGHRKVYIHVSTDVINIKG